MTDEMFTQGEIWQIDKAMEEREKLLQKELALIQSIRNKLSDVESEKRVRKK